MKKNIIVFILIMILLSLTGCGDITPRNAVENFLNQYKDLSSDVLIDVESVIAGEDFTQNQEDKYRNIIKKQYQDLEYVINGEEFIDDKVIVNTNITVYNLYKAQDDAGIYLNDHYDEFVDSSGNYDSSAFIDYKLKMMENTIERVNYNIDFVVAKNDEESYEVTDITRDILEKIHGIYDIARD